GRDGADRGAGALRARRGGRCRAALPGHRHPDRGRRPRHGQRLRGPLRCGTETRRRGGGAARGGELMAGPMTGMRVVELGLWVAGPSAGGVLADWGAEVVKIEPPDGDPFRGLYLSVSGVEIPANPPFELDNRGKRSIALDLRTEDGRRITGELIDRADVFVTNVRPEILESFGLDDARLRAQNPRLVYARVTGYGESGPDRDRPAYDIGAFWSRAGIAAALTPPGSDPPYQRGAMGDHIAGMTLAGGIAAALLARMQSGAGQMVTTSLLRVGAFVLGWDTSATLRLGIPATPFTRTTTP